MSTIDEQIMSYTKGYLEQVRKSLRAELKQDIRSYVDHAMLEHDITSAHAVTSQGMKQDRHGQRWEPQEDRDLAVELGRFINSKAKACGRSEEAIKLRIHKQRLLW